MQKSVYIGYEIHTLDKMIGRTLHALFEKEELTKMQSWIIRYLYDHQGEALYQKDIEAQFHIARSTATGVLQGMEKRGYLRRETIASDARLKRLVLTEKACNLQEELIQTIQEMEAAIRKDISEEEIEVFLKILKKMQSNLKLEKTTERSSIC